MSEIIYGHHPVLEALRAGLSIEKVFIEHGTSRAKMNDIFALSKKRRVPVKEVPRAKMVQLSGQTKTQGVIAFLQQQSYATVADILKRSDQLGEPPLVALLDSIEDPHNLGAILRAADGAGVHGVILPKRRSAGLTATVAKTSAGASAHVPAAQVSNLNYTIDELKQKNVWIVGADQNGEKNYSDADLSGALGIVIGAEGKGLHRLVKQKCDFLVKIPMCGKVNSLNASVAAALLFFEARRQREIA